MGYVEENNEFQEIEHPLDEPGEAEEAVGRTTRSSRRRDRYRPLKTAFIWRMMAAFLGAAVLLLIEGLAYGNELRSIMNGMTADIEGQVWAQYAGMGGIIFACILAVSIVAGLLDSSAARAFFLGAGLCAALAVAALIYQSKNQAACGEMAPAIRMSLAALNPGYSNQLRVFEEAKAEAAEAKDALEKELAAEKQKVEDANKTASDAAKELAELKDTLPDKLEEAKKEGADAKAAEVQAVLDEKEKELGAKQGEIDAKQQELEAAQKELADAQASIEQLEAEKKKTMEARSDHTDEMAEALKKLEDAQNRIKELEEANKKLEEELEAAKKSAADNRRRRR